MHLSSEINIDILKKSWDDVEKHFPNAKPFGSFIFGAGWKDAIKTFRIKDELPYSKITGFGAMDVVGQTGKLLLAEYYGREFFIFQGRRYLYEGLGWTPVILPSYIAKKSGSSILFATNTSEGVTHEPGDLMIITDHINSMDGNPLLGAHYPELGPRFPDMTSVYDKNLIMIMQEISRKTGIKLVKGIFRGYCGPAYETPAEIQFSKIVNADASGVSIVPEAILANAMGLKVAAITCIANYAPGQIEGRLSYEQVIKTVDSAMYDIQMLVSEIVRYFAVYEGIINTKMYKILPEILGSLSKLP